MIFLLLSTARADCHLAVVHPEETARLGVETDRGWLATGSVVQVWGACPMGVQATVRAQNWRYRTGSDAPLPVGAEVCIPEAALSPLTGRLIASVPPPGVTAALPPGTLLSDLTCTAPVFSADPIGVLEPADLAWLRPISDRQHADIAAVHDAYTERFGPLSLGAVPFTDWGHVGLPLPHPMTDAEIAAEAAAENLRTDDQREKVTTDLGPLRDGVPLYTHFTGADPRFSDAWARPETITSLLDLAHRWAQACPATDRRACTLQIGDLAWYAGTRPDPLGHRDHYRGTCLDIRLFRDDGSRYEAYHSQPDDRDGVSGGYSAALTTAFLALAAGPASVLYFNDPDVLTAVPEVSARRGHDDHIHLCF